MQYRIRTCNVNENQEDMIFPRGQIFREFCPRIKIFEGTIFLDRPISYSHIVLFLLFSFIFCESFILNPFLYFLYFLSFNPVNLRFGEIRGKG